VAFPAILAEAFRGGRRGGAHQRLMNLREMLFSSGWMR
jgi:hypothetical protein